MEIKAAKNGPYLLPGPVVWVDEKGQEHTMEGKVIALCRCGRSANKPFCDGSHKKAPGFEAEEVVLSLGR
ncbi:MAG TPA: CDGSH iron-sulfur domain-containing protein [Anaerolineales bacterium]|nr:CDGSH iron-sulfur domain-containing protein [Anaerolineales bacterium]HIQ00649.1 CDGSH iron-sulfur domain-containing protein [Anaerolineales bacterium]